jgi:hypothetical protein
LDREGLVRGCAVAVGVTAEQVTRLTFQCLADASKGGEADRSRAAIFEDGKVDVGNASTGRKLCERHAPFCKEAVEVDTDGVVFV